MLLFYSTSIRIILLSTLYLLLSKIEIHRPHQIVPLLFVQATEWKTIAETQKSTKCLLVYSIISIQYALLFNVFPVRFI